MQDPHKMPMFLLPVLVRRTFEYSCLIMFSPSSQKDLLFTDLPLEHVVCFVIYLGLPYRLCEEVLKKPWSFDAWMDPQKVQYIRTLILLIVLTQGASVFFSPSIWGGGNLLWWRLLTCLEHLCRDLWALRVILTRPHKMSTTSTEDQGVSHREWMPLQHTGSRAYLRHRKVMTPKP